MSDKPDLFGEYRAWQQIAKKSLVLGEKRMIPRIFGCARKIASQELHGLEATGVFWSCPCTAEATDRKATRHKPHQGREWFPCRRVRVQLPSEINVAKRDRWPYPSYPGPRVSAHGSSYPTSGPGMEFAMLKKFRSLQADSLVCKVVSDVPFLLLVLFLHKDLARVYTRSSGDASPQWSTRGIGLGFQHGNRNPSRM